MFKGCVYMVFKIAIIDKIIIVPIFTLTSNLLNSEFREQQNSLTFQQFQKTQHLPQHL